MFLKDSSSVTPKFNFLILTFPFFFEWLSFILIKGCEKCNHYLFIFLGRQFDKDGNLKQWWNEATVRRFRERAQCIIDQYSSYVLEDIGHNVSYAFDADFL